MSTRVVVEWTRGSLRMAVAEGRGKRRKLRALRSVPIDAGTNDVETLRRVQQELRVKGKSAIVVIPREQVITRTVKFPSIDPDELAQMVELYSKAQLPYQTEQAVIDYTVARRQDSFSTVIMVACPRETVGRFLVPMKEAGIGVDRVMISTSGVCEWYRQTAPRVGVTEPALMIHLDETRTDLVVISGGIVLSSRSIGQGIKDWNQDEQVVEILMLEVERSRAALRREVPEDEVRSLVLAGAGSLPMWRDLLTQRTGLAVTVLEPTNMQAAGLMPGEQRLSSPIVVSGIALGDPHQGWNLSPRELKASLTSRRQVRDLITISVLSLATLIMGATVLSLQASRHHQAAEQMDGVLAGISPRAKQVQEKRRLTSAVQSVLNQRRRLARVVSGVFDSLGPELLLEAVSFEGARSELAIRGSAPSTQAVLEYLGRLKSLESVQDARLKYTRQRNHAGQESTDFELILTAAFEEGKKS